MFVRNLTEEEFMIGIAARFQISPIPETGVPKMVPIWIASARAILTPVCQTGNERPPMSPKVGYRALINWRRLNLATVYAGLDN